MKRVGPVILLFLLVSGTSRADPNLNVDLPPAYKADIRNYVLGRWAKESPRPELVIGYYSATIASVTSGQSTIPRDKAYSMVEISVCPLDSHKAPLLMVVDEVVAFENGRIVGSAEVRDVKWLNGKPKRDQ
jgi:hypothetical protein